MGAVVRLAAEPGRSTPYPSLTGEHLLQRPSDRWRDARGSGGR
ncbi:hypothetical protein SAMN05660463_01327 [Pseudomonas sp. URIL14HWK12:I9]|nr:hypothetical protein F474_02339 [Pseudomonas sp. URIL14HWK12:I12]PVZ24935.1 hypothetical protein F470_01994 [Pseudomonas sp. URIL14HWK12:I10]PVZ34781.1 hypothetical protein F472_02340 [Pseudomonas sp. URIL14HWK12:I11]SNZ09279.1 hypothetical protein SAMN05660463_01327 [Pseudomonas sp. URIL14HWK12:I9]